MPAWSATCSIRAAAYVVKDPWLFSYCDQIDPGEVEVEALLVPVRELAASATSRILQERITMAESFWSDLQPSDVHGMVPGGAVYSLDPVDQARILAVGFHRLILWATTRRIPLFLLEFPRIVGDGEYLIDTLWPWLGEHCERDRAVEAFVSVADPGLVRVDGGQVRMPEDHTLEAGQLDRAAMSVLLKERQVTLDATRRELAVAEQRLVDAERRLAEVRDELGASQHAAVEAEQAFVSRLAAVDAALAQRSIALGRTEQRAQRGRCPARGGPWHVELAAHPAVACTARCGGPEWRRRQRVHDATTGPLAVSRPAVSRPVGATQRTRSATARSSAAASASPKRR